MVTGGLGLGGCAVVVRAEHKHTGRNFALKVISKSKVRKSQEVQGLAVEVEILTKVLSPYLLKGYETVQNAHEVFLVMELVEGGDLFHHLVRRVNEKGSGFSEKEARVILAEIVLALEAMHDAGFIHRNVKVILHEK